MESGHNNSKYCTSQIINAHVLYKGLVLIIAGAIYSPLSVDGLFMEVQILYN